MLTRGDIHWVEFPKPKDHPSREQYGIRPALIIQNESTYHFLPTVIVVPITSKLKTARIAGTHVIVQTAENGLPYTSVALVFQTRAIDRARIKQRVGILALPDLRAIENLLANITQ